MHRSLQDNPPENDEKVLSLDPIHSEDESTTNAPTPTEMFPVELTTSPTPTALLSPTLTTMNPTAIPKLEPSTRFHRLEISIQSTEYANPSSTVIITIVISAILCLTCIYCVCCRKGKESVQLTLDGKRDFNFNNAANLTPTRSPRSKVEVINPYSREDQPLLSPPRNRPVVRKERDRTPVRAARLALSSPSTEGCVSDSFTGVDDINI